MTDHDETLRALIEDFYRDEGNGLGLARLFRCRVCGRGWMVGGMFSGSPQHHLPCPVAKFEAALRVPVDRPRGHEQETFTPNPDPLTLEDLHLASSVLADRADEQETDSERLILSRASRRFGLAFNRKQLPSGGHEQEQADPTRVVRYDDNGGRCFNSGCTDPAPLDLRSAAWLAYEVADGPDVAVPMHPACAEGPWPMYSVPQPPTPPSRSAAPQVEQEQQRDRQFKHVVSTLRDCASSWMASDGASTHAARGFGKCLADYCNRLEKLWAGAPQEPETKQPSSFVEAVIAEIDAVGAWCHQRAMMHDDNALQIAISGDLLQMAIHCDAAVQMLLNSALEPWNPDLTTAPRDQRIKLQLPPYVTGHLTTVVSVEPIAWTPDEDEQR